jgi:hypothetical protein
MPSKKIIFVFERINQNKWFAPLVDEALSRNLDVECWLDHRDISQTTKWYERPELEKMPKFLNGTPAYKTFVGPEGLAGLIAEQSPAVIFSDRPSGGEKSFGQLWVHVVTSYYDSFAGMLPPELNRFDLIFCTTKHWVEASLKFYVLSGRVPEGAPELDELRKRIRVTGVPQFDHFAMLEKNSAKRQLGIPAEKKVVTVYAFEPGTTFWATRLFQVPSMLRRLFYILILPLSYPRFFTKVGRSKLFSLCWHALAEKPKFLKATFLEPTDLAVLRAIREFCDRNSYFFLLKFRAKYPPFAYQLGIADKELFTDEYFYPYTSAMVIAASEILIGTFSTSTGEAVFAGTSAINLHPDDPYIQIRTQFRLIYKKDNSALEEAYNQCVHDLKEGAFYSYPGAVKDMTFRKFCEQLPHQTLADFAPMPERQKEYSKKYVQNMDGPAAPRIIDSVLAYESS